MRSTPLVRLALLGLCCLVSACKLERAPSVLEGDQRVMKPDGGKAMPSSDPDTGTSQGGSGGAGMLPRDGAVDDPDASGDGGPDGGGAPPKDPEVCDGKDDDLDGEIDEDLDDLECGVGACSVVVKACVDGKPQKCKPKAPAKKELCNEIDDDCNGKVDESADDDADGFSICDGDCCDAPGKCGTGTPALVNPGAFEVLGNTIDDDCDDATQDDVKQLCESAPLDIPTTAGELAQAMDLCRVTTRKPKSNARSWGVISAKLFAADHTSLVPADIQVGVLAQYGTNVLPQAGPTLAAISTGTARDEDDLGFKAPEYDDSWKGNSGGTAPAAYLEAHGGMLPPDEGVCPNTEVNDSVALELRLRVPTNAHSFSLRFKLYSAEFPERPPAWLCHDYFLALVTTKAAGVPEDGNIASIVPNQPIALDETLFNICESSVVPTPCSGGSNDLAGTGMQRVDPNTQSAGAATAWFTARAPVTPGEELVIELMVWDAGDPVTDTIALLDAFDWSVDTAVAGSQP